ncbi:MAG: hypothetical protein WBW53_12585 [Terriglobales bacterium]
MGAAKASSVNHPSKGILKILFKEILEQITPDEAEHFTKAYREGKEIGLRIRENSRGIGYKTAFHLFVEPGRAISTPVDEIKAMAANKCSVCDRELTNGKCVFINHKG